MTTRNDVILKRIETMEAELKDLRKLLKPTSVRKAKPRRASHEQRVNEDDFQEARRSLFKHSDDPGI